MNKTKELLKVVITEKDLNKYKPIWKSQDGKEYPYSFSPSGMLIDELAYASGQWTSEDLWENNSAYEPSEPYDFNYEADLFANTKTNSQLSSMVTKLCSPNLYISFQDEETKDMQAGAYCALKYPEDWKVVLEAYKDKLQQDRTEGISKKYNEDLQKEIDSFYDDLRQEWLHGDYRNFIGVIKEIQKYFNAEGVAYSEKESDVFTFYFDKEEAKETLENWNSEKLTIKNYKNYLLQQIVNTCENRKYKEKQKNEERKAERERLQAYKKEQAEKDEAERREKLLAMKLN